jgi:hypothetical protein
MGVSALLLAGCLSAPFEPPMGVFSQIQAPLSVEHSRTAVTSKRGEATTTCILGLFSTGDASTQTAAKNGGLSVIHYLDYNYENFLGVYQKTTVIAHGE